MKKLWIILLTLFVFGCSSQPMPKDWHPITTITERPGIPSVSDGTITTVSPYLIVKDIDKFWKDYPLGSARLEALRRHEVIHAKSQESYGGGKIAWLRRYLFEKKFRWEEEKKGWREEILHLKNTGHGLNIDAIAEALSGKGYSNMVSFAEARRWVMDVIAGRA